MYETNVLETDRTEDQPVSAKTRAKSRSHDKSRRMQLLERMGCFDFENQTILIERATTVDDLCDVFKLAYDCYVEKGYIKSDDSGMRIRIYDLMPETATFVAKDKCKVVGVTGAVIDSPNLRVPTDKVFHKELELLRRAGRKICEGTNWLIAPEYRRSCVLTELTRCCLAQAIVLGCHDLLATVSPGHRPYYELLGFELFGSERNYSKDDDVYDPVVLLRLRVDGLDERFAGIDINGEDDEAILKRHYIVNNPYHDKIELWTAASDAFFHNSALLRELFVKRTNFLATCSPQDLAIIRQRWGDELLNDVLRPSLVDLIRQLSKLLSRGENLLRDVLNRNHVRQDPSQAA